MSSLLTGLSVAWLLLSLFQLCRRRRPASVIYVPILLLPPSPPDRPANHDAWLRKQLASLEPDE